MNKEQAIDLITDILYINDGPRRYNEIEEAVKVIAGVPEEEPKSRTMTEVIKDVSQIVPADFGIPESYRNASRYYHALRGAYELGFKNGSWNWDLLPPKPEHLGIPQEHHVAAVCYSDYMTAMKKKQK